MSFDKKIDLTSGVCFYLYKICHVAPLYRTQMTPGGRVGCVLGIRVCRDAIIDK